MGKTWIWLTNHESWILLFIMDNNNEIYLEFIWTYGIFVLLRSGVRYGKWPFMVHFPIKHGDVSWLYNYVCLREDTMPVTFGWKIVNTAHHSCLNVVWKACNVGKTIKKHQYVGFIVPIYGKIEDGLSLCISVEVYLLCWPCWCLGWFNIDILNSCEEINGPRKCKINIHRISIHHSNFKCVGGLGTEFETYKCWISGRKTNQGTIFASICIFYVRVYGQNMWP